MFPVQVQLVGLKSAQRQVIDALALYAQLGKDIAYSQALPPDTEAITVYLAPGNYLLYAIFTIGRVSYRQGATVEVLGMATMALDLGVAKAERVVPEPSQGRKRKRKEDGR